MTEPQVAPNPPKKGLSPLAWIAIGCAGIIIVGGLAAVIGGGYFLRSFANKFEKNPAMTTAEMIVRANPDLELVSSDADAGTLTIRNKKTGEEVTVDLDEVKEGKIGFKTGDQESTVTFGGAGNEGAMTVTDKDGKTTFRAGATNLSDIPDWVPMYGDATPSGAYQMDAGGEHTGGFTLSTGDTPKEVLDYYGRVIQDLGGEVTRHTFSSDDTQGGIIAGGTPDGKRKLNATVSGKDGETTVLVTYSEQE